MRIADDFGLGRKHDQVILSLLETETLDGTSVMTGDAMMPEDVARLRTLRAGGAKVGLHLNLTQAIPGNYTVWPLSALMQPRLNARMLDEINASLSRQVAAFVDLFGSLPDYYDGHQRLSLLSGNSTSCEASTLQGRNMDPRASACHMGRAMA
jgi:predicted glycoside hydrolase/deacetylase ChbG (UPF0249 family)